MELTASRVIEGEAMRKVLKTVFGVAAVLFLGMCAGCSVAPSVKAFPNYDNDVAGLQYEASFRLQVICVETVTAQDGAKSEKPYRVGGSGVAVSGRHILTAKHVIDCEDARLAEVVAVHRDGARIPVTVDALPFQPDLDVARLVAVSGSPFKTFAIASQRKPKLAEEVCIVAGDFAGVHSLRKCGAVAETTTEWITVSMHGVPGNSGSALFDAKGNVIGILSRGRWFEGAEFVTLFVPAGAFVDLFVSPWS